MPNFTERKLLQIIEAGESDRVEFKESLSGDAATRIREAICAFANDLPDHRVPGLVFVGVKNDGTMGNLSVKDRLLQQLADMKTDGNILPPPFVDRGKAGTERQRSCGHFRVAIRLAASSLQRCYPRSHRSVPSQPQARSES